MEKPQLHYNEYLRYTFAGGFGVLTYLYLNPGLRSSLFDEKGTIKDSLFLILLSLVLGSFIYAVHRAFFFPLCLRINFIILRISGKLDKESSWPDLLFRQKEIKKQDFRRWKQRNNPQSFTKNLTDWFSQIHFLYCCVWVMLASWFLTNKDNMSEYFCRNWLLACGILFLIALRTHYRSLLYDLEVDKHDNPPKQNEQSKNATAKEQKVDEVIPKQVEETTTSSV